MELNFNSIQRQSWKSIRSLPFARGGGVELGVSNSGGFLWVLLNGRPFLSLCAGRRFRPIQFGISDISKRSFLLLLRPPAPAFLPSFLSAPPLLVFRGRFLYFHSFQSNYCHVVLVLGSVPQMMEVHQEGR